MTTDTLVPLADAMLAIIKSCPGASFPELTRKLESRYPMHGTWSTEPQPNVLLWAGMSEEFCDAVDELWNDGLAHPHVLGELEAILVHSADGGMLSIPYAARPPEGGYRKPHWAPVLWYPGPICDAKSCTPH